VRFASAGVWDAANGWNRIGTITIAQSATGMGPYATFRQLP
jgi:hypothetical protein